MEIKPYWVYFWTAEGDGKSRSQAPRKVLEKSQAANSSIFLRMRKSVLKGRRLRNIFERLKEGVPI